MRAAGFMLLILAIMACKNAASQYNEKYRPLYHFSPKKGWIGDPDGLVKFKGKYHLFWWGHAVSTDLVHWQELPYPMQGGKGFSYFSGSVAVDKNNTAGFGDSSMIAIYTMHTTDDVPEAQAISYSNDDTLFHFYKENPVLDIQSNSFRDPQVFWYAPAGRWIMLATRPHLHQVSFYASDNLRLWQHLSDFGPMGAQKSDWEVPDIFELPVDGDPKHKKWVLTIGQGPNRMQYFLGNFDGNKFTPDEQTTALQKKQDPVAWADYGTDFYAARTWRNLDDTVSNNLVWLGWMGNWSYARIVPTSWGKGFESIPREISLKTIGNTIKLIQTPAAQLAMLRGSAVEKLDAFKPEKNAYEFIAELDITNVTATGFNLLEGNGRKLVVGYDIKAKQLYVDRTNCTDFTTDSVFNKSFPAVMYAPLELKNGILKLHVLVDQSSVEIFANDGEITISTVTFPAETQTGISLFAKDAKPKLKHFTAWPLQSIWK